RRHVRRRRAAARDSDRRAPGRRGGGARGGALAAAVAGRAGASLPRGRSRRALARRRGGAGRRGPLGRGGGHVSPSRVLCYHRLAWHGAGGWRARGFDSGSHTTSHARLTWLDDAGAADGLGRAREALVQRLGASAGRAVAYPFGAADARVERLARSAGYELGFGGVRGNGGAMHVPRIPVYVWDAWRVPLGLEDGGLGALGRFVAHIANRCAVGTSWMLKLRQEHRAHSSS